MPSFGTSAINQSTLLAILLQAPVSHYCAACTGQQGASTMAAKGALLPREDQQRMQVVQTGLVVTDGAHAALAQSGTRPRGARLADSVKEGSPQACLGR